MSFDPVTRLSAAEVRLLHHINENYTRDQTLSKLKSLLQTAVEIELATIPIYLYTYYSIDRTVHTGKNLGVRKNLACLLDETCTRQTDHDLLYVIYMLTSPYDTLCRICV